MRYLYLLAGLLCIGTLIVHALMGGIETLNPVMASPLVLEIRVAILAIWHGMTLVFILSAMAFFWAFAADRSKSRAVGLLLGCFYALFGGLFATLSFLWFEDLMILPQWTLLAPIGIFALIASI
ncbi:MAG: hypothetical protein GY927_10700 [bacterium]|nr:hypothetical protein [bacterium]